MKAAGRCCTVSGRSWLGVVLIAAVMLTCSAVWAETYYVSTSGNDNWDGKSWGTAFRSIRWGCGFVKTPGDTLIIGPGQWNESAGIAANGTPGAPITVKAQEPGTVTMRGTGTGNGFTLNNREYVVVEGIKFTNFGLGLVIAGESAYVTIRKCIFYINNQGGILISGPSRTDSSLSHHHLITENQFLDYAASGPGSPYSGSGIQDYGVYAYCASNLEIVNNYFYGHHHQCLSFKERCIDSRAANNVFHGAYYTAIYLGQNLDVDTGYPAASRNLIAEGNVFRPTTKYRLKSPVWVANVVGAIVRDNFMDTSNGYSGQGIGVADVARDVKLYRNLIIDTKGSYDNPGLRISADCEIYNNTIVNTHFGLEFEFTSAGQVINVVCKNNLFHNNRRAFHTYGTGDYSGGVFKNNDWHPAYSGMDPTEISVDPRFVGPIEPITTGELDPVFVPDFTRTDAYHLADDSLCIDAGTDVGLPYNGSAPDIGAFEWAYVPPSVVGRYVFYNGSIFDGNDSSANAADDDAIATDKAALLPGQTATFANYTSYVRGINGVMVDIGKLPGTPTAADFAFKVGNDNNPGQWATATAPTSVTVRAEAGVDRSSRVTIVWPIGAIQKQWLQVTVKATAATGLTEPDVFYFGNAAGDSGNSSSDTKVDTTDEIRARLDPHKHQLNPADVENPHDYTRDGVVNTTDEIIARFNNTTLLNDLNLITVP